MAKGERKQSQPVSGGDISFVTENPLPADPYNWRLQQWGVLRQLGYSVEIVETPIHEAREAYSTLDERIKPFFDYRLGIFKNWWRPGVLDPKFVPWVEGGILPDFELPDITLSQQYDLHNHPAATLPNAVDNGHFKKVKSYLGRARLEHPAMYHDGDYEGTFKSCYVSAMGRLIERAGVAPYYLEIGGGEGIASRSEIKLYNSFVSNGMPPVSSEALGAMVEDFYHMLGSVVPEFSDFSSRVFAYSRPTQPE